MGNINLNQTSLSSVSINVLAAQMPAVRSLPMSDMAVMNNFRQLISDVLGKPVVKEKNEQIKQEEFTEDKEDPRVAEKMKKGKQKENHKNLKKALANLLELE